MNYNKIKAVFGHLRKATTPAISYQYDQVQFLQIEGLDLPAFFEVDFCNDGDSTTITMPGDADGVQIPDDFLTTGKPIKGYIVLTGEDDGAVETRYEITIPVNTRPTRTDIAPTPVEQQQIDQLIEKMNEAVTVADEKAQEATEQAAAAENSAGDAATEATRAESWAVGGTGTREGEDTNNARFWSELAQQGAQESGFAFFDIDDETGIMYVTITESLAEDVSFQIDEETGVLEVIYA